MRIGELAKATNTKVETIRYYESKGLISITFRGENNYRCYSQIHVERLSFIRLCRNLDMSLEEIYCLLHFMDLPEENCEQVNLLLNEHLGHVVNRIKELRRLEKQLTILRDTCTSARASKDCGILNKLTMEVKRSKLKNFDKETKAQNSKSVLGHVHGVHRH